MKRTEFIGMARVPNGWGGTFLSGAIVRDPNETYSYAEYLMVWTGGFYTIDLTAYRQRGWIA